MPTMSGVNVGVAVVEFAKVATLFVGFDVRYHLNESVSPLASVPEPLKVTVPVPVTGWAVPALDTGAELATAAVTLVSD